MLSHSYAHLFPVGRGVRGSKAKGLPPRKSRSYLPPNGGSTRVPGPADATWRPLVTVEGGWGLFQLPPVGAACLDPQRYQERKEAVPHEAAHQPQQHQRCCLACVECREGRVTASPALRQRGRASGPAVGMHTAAAMVPFRMWPPFSWGSHTEPPRTLFRGIGAS